MQKQPSLSFKPLALGLLGFVCLLFGSWILYVRSTKSPVGNLVISQNTSPPDMDQNSAAPTPEGTEAADSGSSQDDPTADDDPQ